jgi:DNA relaxase NicK
LRKLQEISADKSGAVYAQMFAKEVADARKELREPPSAEEYAKSIRSFLSVFKPTVVDDTKSKVNQNVYARPSP